MSTMENVVFIYNLYQFKCLCDWFKKQADWPIAEWDKVKQESQTENDGMRKDRVRRVTIQMEMSQTHKMGWRENS